MDDFERSVQTMLRDRVVDLEPAITGDAIRAKAARRRPRSSVPLMAAAAAAVVAVALVPILVSRGDSTPVRPGAPSTGTSQLPIYPPPSSTPTISTPRPASPSPRSATGTPTGTGTAAPLPSRTGPTSASTPAATTSPTRR